MRHPDRHLSPAEAARRLGVSAKALRLYEERGLVRPLRSAAGWRTYGPDELTRAAEVVALRALGLSLAEVAAVQRGEPGSLGPALAAHQSVLESRLRDVSGSLERVHALRARLAAGTAPAPGQLASLLAVAGPSVTLALPWPWAGEPFELMALHALTYITGSLGSGKTRLARALAGALDAPFLGLDRLAGPAPEPSPALAAALAWLEGEGATGSPALRILLGALVAATGPLVVDMIEDGLDEPSQQALAAWLRRRAEAAPPLVMLTRSSALLELEAVGPRETIIYCPANHSPPVEVLPHPGAPGYEALASCLASPAVRARTAGVIALRPPAAG